jgi:hypothetical protein
LAYDAQVIDLMDDDLETVLISANPNLLRPSCERIPPTLMRLTDALLRLHADNGDLNWVRAVIDELEGFDIGPQAPFVPLPEDEDTQA